jgi:hypothetical protein
LYVPGARLSVDAQTSGGLLLAVNPAALDAVLGDLQREGTPASAVIGTLTDERVLRVT